MWQTKFLEIAPLWLTPATISISISLFTFIILRKRFNLKSDDIDINQSELDSYLNSNLSSFEVGTLYERYIGYLFEKEGYYVKYHGALRGYDDLGRDLILKKDNEVWIVQTKCWSKHKQVQEKHIFQLFGTLEYYKRQERNPMVKAIFFTTATYSKTAMDAAFSLGVELRIEKLDRSYPMIKCNVSNRTNDKIYHLPFDDYYDNITIIPDKGEFYAKTVKDAVARGFRRARKYRKTG